MLIEFFVQKVGLKKKSGFCFLKYSYFFSTGSKKLFFDKSLWEQHLINMFSTQKYYNI